MPGAEDVLPAPLPPYRVLTGLADRFGRTLTYRREAAGDLAGEITGVTDGAGREFRLVLTTQAQRAEEARTSSLSSSDSSRPLSASPFPDTLPGTEYGPDRGIRLSAVWLMHDPAYPESLPGAPLARYTYTEAGELLAVYDRSNTQVRAFTYDAQHPGRMVAHRYAGRPEMRYRYDDTGRVVEQLNPAGLSYRYQYEQDRITVTDSLNRREVLHTEGGAGLKRVVKKELADGSVTHSGYDAAGRLTAQTDAAGRRTEYGLNVVSGDITDITTPDGRETKFYYNDGNQLTAVVSPDGLESRRAYDEPGRLVSETSRSGDVIRYAYDNPHSELPATTTDATGSTRQMTWSRYGQLLAFTDCSGYQTRYEYDRFGQMTAVHREEGISLYRRYDNRGRLTSVKDAQGRETRYEYNAAGDLTAVITPDGNRSETQYDAWGKAVSTTQGGLTRSMEYDAAGRVISLTNENGSHSVFSYDALDRLVQQGGFDGRTQRYHYDLTGKLTQSEDEGLVTLWYYDESDRITHRTVNGEPAEQWQYDDHGWLTDISHLSEGHRVAVHYGYDDKGRLTGERQTVENPETGELLWQHETTHAYNEQGLANRVTPDSLPPVEWLTYGSGYLAGMKLGDTPLLEYTRDRMHRETVRSFGSMAGSNAAYKLTSTYTPAGQLQSQHLNSLVYDRDYGWNDNGDLVRISGPRQTREYGYSATGRLESVRTLAPDLDIRIPYATDPAGNRLPDPELHPDSTLTAWPDNPRGQMVSQKDAQGRETRYEYSAAGDLTATVSPDGKRSTIAYDKRGRPVSVTEGGLTRSMGYDAAGRITVLTNENGSQSTFRYDPVDRLTEQRGFDGRTQRYHYDLTGKLTQSEDEGLITLWHYDASDRITHRTVNGDPAEQWQYDEHGWLTTLSHTCEGHRVSVHYGYDDKGRLTGERQTVENPETGEMLWEHETGHAYSEQGLATRQEPDGLPPVEWLTYGSGYLAGMKLGGTPLVEYTRDRLHRETARSFGGAGSTAGYEQATAYTLTGQLQSRHLNLPQLDCDYTWNDNGQLVRISGPQECREYRYSGTGRLTGVHTTAANLDIDIPYATDPAGNRLPDPELHPDSTLTAWPDNRIAEDAHYVYRYDEYGRLAEKTDRIPEGVIRMHDERTHHYHYDSQHRLVFYTRIQHGEPQVESRYLYDPLGRRTGKRVWRRERDLTGWMSLSRKPEETWYGWDGDRLTTVQTQQTRIQTVYQPGSFTPLLRIETENGEQAKARHRSLAEVLQEDTGVTLPAELAVMLGRLERELRQGSVSEESQQWLAQCGLTAEQMAAQLEAEYIPERKLHLYHCDHRGLPLALISPEGETAWQGEYDEWGNLLGEESAQHLQQSLRLPGQQYDEESGLYYNRNRYYDPLQGRYITQDPIGLRGEWNLYKYPLNPVRFIDSLGLKFHVNGDPSDFNQAVEYLKQDSQMKETIDFLSSSEETINIEYIEGTNVRFNSNNMAIYWNSRASLFCSTELNSKSQSPALGLGHEFAHAQYYLLDKENFMALLSRTDKKYENKEEARVITIIESRAAKTLGECTRGAHSGLPFYRVDGPLQTMKITGTPE
ncbi:RHS repeat-associated core domain-containing protein [Escherichia coli]|uniref:RHS repeat-associated core domain-containing protein n=1 Tax=Escherichia coli TaxID=562 RepID=UPI003D6D10A3